MGVSLRMSWTAACAVALLGGCSSAGTGPSPAATTLLAVSPRGGDTAVATSVAVTVRFSHAMPPTMAGFVALHRGDVTGPLVPCGVTWSADSTTMVMTPDSALAPHSGYTLHVGGGMHDAMGGMVDLAPDGPMMGGQWATSTMMTGDSMMGGGMGSQEMGPGWSGPGSDYGLVFTFTTA